MSSYLDTTYNNILTAINDNYFIEDLDDYEVFDASFITDHLNHIKFVKDFLILGIYRVRVNAMGFYTAPYVHMKNIQGCYEPRMEEIPQKKSFLQKIKLASSPKPEYRLANKYKASLAIEEVIPQDIADTIPLPSENVLVDDWNGEGVWDIFLIDNLKYMLPAFGPGNYKKRTFITNREQLLKLPSEVSNQAFSLTFDILPKVIYKNGMLSFLITYFNDWEGLVQLKTNYANTSKVTKNVIANKLVFPEDEKNILIGYKSGTRF